MAELNLISLPPGLLDSNRDILWAETSAEVATLPTRFGGTVHNGHSSVTATIAPGAPGKIDLTFDISVPSVTSPAFSKLRQLLTNLLSPALSETEIAAQAGIGPSPPPPPDSRMAAYASQLFGAVFFSGQPPVDENQSFRAAPGSGHQVPIVNSIRNAAVGLLDINGTISIEATENGADAAVYIPTTAIVFDDGLTIPFSGYSETALVDLGTGLVPAQLPTGLWRPASP